MQSDGDSLMVRGSVCKLSLVKKVKKAIKVSAILICSVASTTGLKQNGLEWFLNSQKGF